MTRLPRRTWALLGIVVGLVLVEEAVNYARGGEPHRMIQHRLTGAIRVEGQRPETGVHTNLLCTRPPRALPIYP